MAVSELTLKQNERLAQADPQAVQWLASRMHIVLLKRRQTLGSQAASFAGLGLVLSGKLQALDLTLDGREVALQTTEAGQLFGEGNPFTPEAAPSLQWVAATACELAVLDARYCPELTDQPSLVLMLAKELARQHRDQMHWQKITNMGSITAKVCAWMLHESAENDVVKLPTHTELAWRLGTTRESVTRVLQRLQSQNALIRQGEHWQVAKPGFLRDLAAREDR